MWQQRYPRPRGHHQWPNDGSDTGLEDPYNRSIPYPTQIRQLIPGQLPPGNIVHDMNKTPFTPQQGLSGANPVQQGVHPNAQNIVFHQQGPQQVASRQQNNVGPSGAQPTSHTQTYYATRTNAPPRQMQSMQGPRQAANMPMTMMNTPNSGNQQSFYTNPVYLQQHLHQQIAHQQHYVYQQHPQQVPGSVEFQPSEALSVPLLQPHSSSRYSMENGDLGSTGMHYRYPTPYPAQPNPQILYNAASYHQSMPYYQPVVSIHQQNRQPGMQPQMGSVQPQPPPPKREKKIIQIIDPATQKDVTEDILSNSRGSNNPTPPTSESSSARGTPPTNVTPPLPLSESDIPAQFARQVAAAASSSGPPLSMAKDISPPPQDLLQASVPTGVPVPPHLVHAVHGIPGGSDNNNSIEEQDLRGQPILSKETVGHPLNGGGIQVVYDIGANAPGPLPSDADETEYDGAGIQDDDASGELHGADVGLEMAEAESDDAPAAVSEPVCAEVVPPVVLPPAQPSPMPSRVHPSEMIHHGPPQSQPPFPQQKMVAVDVASVQRTLIKDGGSLQFGTIGAIPTCPPPSVPLAADKQQHPPPPGLTHPGSTAVIQILSDQSNAIPPAVSATVLHPNAAPYQPIAVPKMPVQQTVQMAPVPPPNVYVQQQDQLPPRQVQNPVVQAPPHLRQNGEVAPSPPLEPAANVNADGLDIDAKDPKKQKGKRKPKETNRKGDTKEGGEMDAFLDKDESTPLPSGTTVLVVPSADVANEEQAPEIEKDYKNDEVTEEMLDEEEQRKVAEKNEENSKVSKELELEDNPPVISEPEIPVKAPFTLKHNYKEEQWSPLNPDGKMQYDRSFLLELQQEPMSQKRPEGLPNLEIIRDNGGKRRVSAYEYGPSQTANKPMGNIVSGHDFTPNFLNTGTPSRSQVRSRPSQQGARKEQQQMQQQMQQRKVVSLSLNQDVKLHESSDAWRPGHKQSKDLDPEIEKSDKLYRKVRAMLNKLTPQNFGTLMNQVANFEINTEDRLSAVIDLVFEKAIDEPNFSVAYANMCKKLSSLKVPSSKGNECVNFKKLIITKCQREFEKDTDDELMRSERVKQIQAAETEDKKKELTIELEEAERKSKWRTLGNIRFIGELFKLSVLTAHIMHDCLNKLITEQDEDSIECLCRLLTTIGKDLDKPPGTSSKPSQPDNRMEQYFKKMKDIINKKQMSSRVRFMLQDVIDLRAQNWIPRRIENNPKTLDQIHREAEKEQLEKQALLQQPIPMIKRPDDRDRRGNMMGGVGGGGKRVGPNDSDGGGWNTVSSNKRTTPTVDPGKTKINRPQEVDEDQIQFGPQRSLVWGRGSSGGVKNNSQEGERPASGPANRFSALATDHSSTADARRNNNRPGPMPLSRDNRGRSAQLPPMSQRSAKPSREREQAIANVKSFSGNELAGPRYPPAGSRDSSVTRENEKKEAETRSKAAPEIDRDAIERKTKQIIDEFLHVNDFQDAVLNVTELCSGDALSDFVTSVLNQVLERSLVARQHTGQLFTALVNQKVVTLDQFHQGLREILLSAEDMEIDMPMFWQYLAEILSPMYESLALPLSSLKIYAEVLTEARLPGKLLSSVINVISKKMLTTKIREHWQASKLKISDFLPPGSDLPKFIMTNKLEFLEGDAQPSTNECLSIGEIQNGLKQILQARQKNECVFDWINAHVPESQQKEPSFIRALVTAIASSAIKTKDDGLVELDPKLFTTLCTVIKRYVDNKDKLELETLYSLQAFVTRLQHPPNLLSHFFQALYDVEVISEEAFFQWKSVEVPQEVEGHAVAVKAVNHFLDFVASNKDQEDDEEVA